MSTSSKITIQSSQSSCTCCKCEHPLESKFHGNRDICFVEGSVSEKTQSLRTPTVSKAVWAKVKPPNSFGIQQPAVSARRTEIVRAQLTRNTKTKKDDTGVPPRKKHVHRSKSKMSNVNFSMSTATH